MRAIIHKVSAILAITGLALLPACKGAQTQDSNSTQQARAQESNTGGELKKNFLEAVNPADISPDSASYRFLLGGFEVLSAVEHILQVRYENYSGELPLMPGGQTALEINPDAKFDPAFIETALTGALEHLELAQTNLEKASGKDFSVRVDIMALWFDINKNGQRDAGEDLVRQLAAAPDFGRRSMEEPEEPGSIHVRFDTADADWLLAYVHALSGSAQLILATDPTSAITTISEGRALMAEKGQIARDPIMGSEDEIIDTIAVILTALRGVPDKTHTRAALAHFKSMIAHNKDFWKQVALETDDEAEWLPNPNQTSAFGPKVSAEMAASWQNVLAEISDVLEGKALIPHWRISQDRNAKEGAGINFAKLMTDPGDFDPILMLHGASVAPYIERGRLMDRQAWRQFSTMTGGQGGLFALWFN